MKRKRFKTRGIHRDDVREWEQVTMPEWDRLLTSEREILLTRSGVVFVRKIR